MTTNSASVAKLPESTIQIADIIRVLRKYGLHIFGLMVLCGVLAAVWAKFQMPMYDAVATVHLDQHTSISLSSIAGASDEYDLKMQTQINGFRDPTIAEKTIRHLELQKNPMFYGGPPLSLDVPQERDKLVLKFLSDLTVTQLPKTELIRIKFRSGSPQLSAIVVNTLVDTYLGESFQQRYRSTQEIESYLTAQLDTLKSKIAGEQADLLNSEARLGILSQGSANDSSLLVNELTGLLQQRVLIEAQLYLAQAAYQNMVAHPEAQVPNDIPGAQSLAALQGQLATQQSLVASLQDRFGPNYPALQQARAQEASLQKSVGDLHATVLQAARENADRAQKSVASINASIAGLQVEAQRRTPDTVKYEILKSQYMGDQTLYTALLSAMGTGAIQAGMQSQVLNRFTIAEIPGEKSFPITRIMVVAGMAAGLVIGLIIVGILVMSSDTVQTVEQVEEALGLPILASVPEYKEDLAAMRISDEVLPLVTLLAPRSAGTEAYRLLRTAISLMKVDQPHRVILLTSCGPGEGKSTTSLNLSVVLATQAKRVLLIDADLRKPTIAQRLKLPATDQPGLSRFLSDNTVLPEECIQRVPEVAGLDVIPVQEIPPFPSELLGQGRLKELMAWARDHYDYVLIDTPPVLLVTDALIIAEHCDTLINVARIGVAQKRALRRIRQDLAKFPGKQQGVVINALPHSDTYYGGYGSYRKYYGGKGSYYGSGTGSYLSTPSKK
ncbi:MAG TPA: polysaccharide biosynthesis tyrosine autokinase [Acidobacteriaceae bacterium]|nr:polysaccharide biosynthesis tyrosine autokinase [Acidobacteriaceae bacterium]